MEPTDHLTEMPVKISATPFELCDPSTIPPRQWLVPDVMLQGEVTILTGEGGTGKSLLALQLAYAVATGRDWLGRQSMKRGPALFITSEDTMRDLHERLAAIGSEVGGGLYDADDLSLVSFAGENAHLMAP